MKLPRALRKCSQYSPSSQADAGGGPRDERFIWESLVPRLLNPGALAIIQVLLQEGRPLSVPELAAAVELTKEHARYHCKAMAKRGVLAVVSDEGTEPTYFFPSPPKRSSSSTPPAAA